MADIRAVAFDLDGLMVNTETLYRMSSQQLLERRGHPPNDDIFVRMMGHTNLEALQIMIDECRLAATAEELLEETSEIMKGLLVTHLQANPGLQTLLDHLRERALPLGIVTNSRRQHAVDVLDRLDLHGCFEWIVSAEDVERGKPDPAVYRLAAERFGVETRQMIALEDSEHGCVAAVAAGAVVVVVPNEHNPHSRFEGAALRVDALDDPRILTLLS